jgi:hypothetical protein
VGLSLARRIPTRAGQQHDIQQEELKMAVVNIPPDGKIYSLGKVPGTMHVYNRGANASTYNLTIIHVNNWQNVNIAVGHTDSYPANGNATYIQNQIGGGTLQCLWVGAADGLTPEQAGLEKAEHMPGVSGH